MSWLRTFHESRIGGKVARLSHSQWPYRPMVQNHARLNAHPGGIGRGQALRPGNDEANAEEIRIHRTLTSVKNPKGIKNLLRALRSRNYRLFVAGQSVSLIGTWMQQVAMSWLVYRLTGSAFLLGVVGFTSQIPTFLLAPVAGVLADRWNRRRLLILTQALAMFQAAILAAAVFAHIIQVWHIIVLSLLLGVVNAFDIPVRQAFVVEMVPDRDDLGNAIALNSSMVQAARLLGPTIAGLLVASVGEGVCFLLNSASYLAVLLALVAMKLGPSPHYGKKKRQKNYKEV